MLLAAARYGVALAVHADAGVGRAAPLVLLSVLSQRPAVFYRRRRTVFIVILFRRVYAHGCCRSCARVPHPAGPLGIQISKFVFSSGRLSPHRYLIYARSAHMFIVNPAFPDLLFHICIFSYLYLIYISFMFTEMPIVFNFQDTTSYRLKLNN